jgi:hypothetical protein
VLALDIAAPPSEYVRPYDGPLMIIPLPLNKVGIVYRIFGTEAPGEVQVDGCAGVNATGAA